MSSLILEITEEDKAAATRCNLLLRYILLCGLLSLISSHFLWGKVSFSYATKTQDFILHFFFSGKKKNNVHKHMIEV